MADIIIIGAGAAGLTAARLLAGKGKAVTVLEARDRIGGRIHTTRSDGFSIPVEHGAEFIHGDLTETLSLVKETNVKLKKSKGRVYSINGGQLEKSDLFPDVDIVMKKLDHLQEDMPMGNFLQRYFGGSHYEQLRQSVTRMVQGLDAADVSKASAFGLRDEWSSEDESKQYHLVGGYGTLIDFLHRQAEEAGVLFVFNTVVKDVRWDRNHVEVVTQDGKYSGGKLITTIPPAVLRTGSVRFTPSIPRQMDEIQKIETGGVIKFLFEFSEPVWERECFRSLPNLHFLFSDAFVPTWWTQPSSDVPLLTGWLSGPVTQTLNMDDEVLLQSGYQSLGYLLGCTGDQLKNHVKATKVINWLADPWARGAYAYKTVTTAHALEVLSRPVEDTIYFAGEAFYGGPEMGTVEAALSSGKTVAAQCLGSGD